MSTEYSDCFLTKGNERQPMPDTGFARFARSDRGIRVVFEQLGLDVDQVSRQQPRTHPPLVAGALHPALGSAQQ